MSKPERFDWWLHVCCNDWRNGTGTGYCDALEVQHADENIMLTGRDMRFHWVGEVTDRFKLSRRVHPCRHVVFWIGNWCWDGCRVTRRTAFEILALTRERGWDWESGTDEMIAYWEALPR